MYFCPFAILPAISFASASAFACPMENEVKSSGFAPLLSATALCAASSSETAATSPKASASLRSPPIKLTTTGFPAFAAIFNISVAISLAGGLLMSTITFVFGSFFSASRPSFIISPPISFFRSRPPVPITWLTPPPS
ncbi:hypothetical protein SDC9_90948 [bioreactor metagenome]|uniref:Uncharacterized protein n=1 Tax=bioreactor metagenome TaxID=1076179 RepID=A0A644ZTH0_9ZZZZ